MYLNVDDDKTYVYTANKAFDAAKPTVVFIHGAANDHSVWTLQSRYFAYHGWNALAVDLPGHGKSTGKPLASIPAAAAWITRVLDAAGAGKAALVGHSMGSLIALETAARHPDRVLRLALVGSAAPMPVSEPCSAPRKPTTMSPRDDQRVLAQRAGADRRKPHPGRVDDGQCHAPDGTLRAGKPLCGFSTPATPTPADWSPRAK